MSKALLRTLATAHLGLHVHHGLSLCCLLSLGLHIGIEAVLDMWLVGLSFPKELHPLVRHGLVVLFLLRSQRQLGEWETERTLLGDLRNMSLSNVQA